jgi:hypothetical protein
MLSRSAIGLVLVAVLSAACEKVPLLAPSESTITATAAAQSLPPGGSTEITAVVVESSGTPVHNGTVVQFSATMGRVEPAEAETRGGVARTTFIAGSSSGTARIRAFSGGAAGGEGDGATNVVEILIGGAATTAVTISATPARVPATGGTVTIVASAVDQSGNRLVGVPVTFSTTAGTLSAGSATTDSSGEARVSLTTNREATVTARAGNQTATATVALGAAGTVSLAVTPENPVAGAPVTLTVTPREGATPRVVVNWGDGAIEDLGIVAAPRTAAHTYQASGNYTVAATATFDGESFNSSVPVSVGTASVTLSAPTPANPTVGTPVTVTVTPAVQGTSSRVVVDWGDGTTTDLGVVSSARTAAHAYGSPGSFIITARATSGSETSESSAAVTVSPRPTLSVSVSATPNPAQRCQAVTFTATVSPSTEAVSEYEWEFPSSGGSGGTVTTTGNSVTRVFSATGTHTVSVTATSQDGREGTGVTQVVVNSSSASC